MKKLRILAAVIFLAAMTTGAKADNDQEDYNSYGNGDAPHVDVWTNKGYDATYNFGEDVAVYFRADQQCYVTVYDIDPSGEVNVLYPNTMSGSTYVEADRVYRVPDTNEDFRMEVSGSSGTEQIYAVASYDYMNPPDFMKYIGYDYGNDQYYDPNYFVTRVRGNLDDFTNNIDNRIASGPYSVAHTRFLVDTNYRHHQHYRYWDYGAYDVGSVWVGAEWPGCEVWIDGVFFGIAPILVPQVLVGYHWVWVYYGGYPCYQRYFYVPAHRRFDIDARFDEHFRDYRYRRDHFRGWVFEEKRYRNEPGFAERARQDQEKNIRVRSLPPTVIRDYVDRGVITKDSPLAKRVRSNEGNQQVRGRVGQPDQPRFDQPRNGQTGNQQPGRVNPGNGDKNVRGRGQTGIEKPNRPNEENPRVIIPENPRTPEKVAPNNSGRRTREAKLIEKHDTTYRPSQENSKPSQPANGQSDNNYKSSERSRPTERFTQPQEKRDNQPSDSGKGSGNVERQRPSNNSGDKGNTEKETKSSGRGNGKSGRGR